MSLTDYSSIEKEITDASEPRVLPAKTEALLRIIKVQPGVIDDQSKNSYGAKYYNVTFDVPDDTLCPMFNVFFWDLTSKDKIDPKQYQQALRQFRDFANTFGIDYSRPFDWETELPRKEGWAVLSIVKDKAGQYPDKNGVSRFIGGPSGGSDVEIPDMPDDDEVPF